MLVDLLIYGLLIFGTAKLLNATAFKLKPASRPVAWSLTTIVFLLSVAFLSVLKALRYQALSDSVGATISPKNPFAMSGAFFSACLFFSFLKREEKNKQPPAA